MQEVVSQHGWEQINRAQINKIKSKHNKYMDVHEETGKV